MTEQIKKQPLLSGLLILFLAAMIFANIGGNMYQSFMPLYVKDLGASIRQIGLFFTLAQIVPLFLQILGGWISDSLGRLRAVAIGSVFGVIGLFSTSLGVISLPSPWIGAQLWDRVNPQFRFMLTAIVLLLSVIPIWIKFKLPATDQKDNVPSEESAVVTTV